MRAAGFEAVGGSDELDGPFGVVRVIDGDTVDVDVGGESVRVRLLNVDTPERGERGFGEAAEALAELAGEDVYLRYDQGGEPTEDAYGRVLAYLYDDQGGNLNEELVREGWSEYYTDYGDGDFPEGFADAEGEAREEGLGLWSGEP